MLGAGARWLATLWRGREPRDPPRRRRAAALVGRRRAAAAVPGALAGGEARAGDAFRPAAYAGRAWTPEEALVEILRGRLEGLGPVTAGRARGRARARGERHRAALAALEAEGFAMRGRFTPGPTPRNGASGGCSRASTATPSSACAPRSSRSPRATSCASCSNGSASTPAARMEGPDAVDAVVAPARRLRGAGRRLGDRDPAGAHRRVRAGVARRSVPGRALAWARLAPSARGRTAASAARRRVAPRRSRCWRAACRRCGVAVRQRRRRCRPSARAQAGRGLHPRARRVVLRRAGARHRPPAPPGRGGAGRAGGARPGDVGQLRRAARAARAGRPAQAAAGGRRRRRAVVFGMEDAGRWALARARPRRDDAGNGRRRGRRARRAHAAAPLRRRVLALARARGRWLPPWRELLRVYRRLEARGEIRGGRFVAGFSGEQFALPEAVGLLREMRRKPASGELDLALRRRSAQPRRHPDAGAEARRAHRQPPALPGRPAGRLACRRRGAVSPDARRRANGRRGRRCCAARPRPEWWISSRVSSGR